MRTPGWTRRAAGRGFAFHDEDGALIRGSRRTRIETLAIPPAWRDVWICHRLPDVRDEVAAALRRRGLGRERVLATGVRLLDIGAFRVGSDSYTEDNGTFGLATLRRDHVQVRNRTVAFRHLAKGGKQREIEITDPPTALLAEHPSPTSRTARTRIVRAAYRSVSDQLGNTPAVCRPSYVDPRVVDRFEHGETIAEALGRAAKAVADRDRQRIVESGVCGLLSAELGLARA